MSGSWEVPSVSKLFRAPNVLTMPSAAPPGARPQRDCRQAEKGYGWGGGPGASDPNRASSEYCPISHFLSDFAIFGCAASFS